MKNKTYDTSAWDKQFDNILKKLDTVSDKLNDYLLDYFKQSFVTKSFGNKRWKPSRMNSNTLIESGDLKKSIKTVSKSRYEIHIQSATPYSAIHNYGGNIRITDKMRKFFWAKYYETKSNDWKAMALTKKRYITIPQRQFMGWNNELRNKINNIIKDVIQSS